ncbi:MAG: hypothetical protein CTY25_04255 [Methylobacterium sp.]|nr:MAG: hypothetical protein CTY25_04255 [Methylobacterium sp.]
MTRLRRFLAHSRDLSLACLAALVLLAGVAQARAATELAGKAHFAGGFALCLQSGLSGDSPDPDHDCDQCRVPAMAGVPAAPASLGQPVERLRETTRPVARIGQPSRAPTSRPEARGPPAAI